MCQWLLLLLLPPLLLLLLLLLPGTITHLAPERFETGSRLTPAVDIYAFGELLLLLNMMCDAALCLYIYWSGQVPVIGQVPVSIVVWLINGNVRFADSRYHAQSFVNGCMLRLSPQLCIQLCNTCFVTLPLVLLLLVCRHVDV
jgi:hypothetical protein